MKRIIRLLIMLASAVGFSQDKAVETDKEKEQKYTIQKIKAPEERAAIRADRLTEQLDLNPEQRERIYHLQLERAREAPAARDERIKRMKDSEVETEKDGESGRVERRKILRTDRDREAAAERREAMKARYEERKAQDEEQMRAILTDEQFTRWKELRENREMNIRKRGGDKSGKRGRSNRK